MPVINDNNSQLNNFPTWAVLLPRTVTTSAMWRVQAEYHFDSRVCLLTVANATTQFATLAVNGKRGYGTDQDQQAVQFSLKTAAGAIVIRANDAVHYQPNSSVLRPGKLTSKCQAAAAETGY